MKSKFTFVLILSVFIFGAESFAQLNGAYSVPGSFGSFAAAISALNVNGVSGPVTINIAAGYTETPVSGGFVLGTTLLNSTLSATNTVTIQKSGTGPNPLFTAPVGTSTTADGIIKIAGADYLTLDGLSLQESAANITATTAMEYGIGFVNLNTAAPFDGCNHNTIRNCSITLNNVIATPSRCIYTAHITTAGTAVTITATGDSHSNNRFYNNTLTNSVYGVQLAGYTAPTPYTLYDQNNEIGGTAAGTGNTITNFGGANYTGISGAAATNQNNLIVSNNTINQTGNGGTNGIGSIFGLNLSGINSTFTISGNGITLSTAPLNTAYTIYGINCVSNGTNFTAASNNISLTVAGGSSVPNYGIRMAGTLTNATLTGNRITQTNNVGTTGTTGSTYGILNSATGTTFISADTVTQVSTVATNNAYYAIVNSATGINETVQNCVFLNSSVMSSGTSGYMELIYTENATPIKNITGNSTSGTITHTTTSIAVAAQTIGIDDEVTTAPVAGTVNFSNNNFSNINTVDISFYGILYANDVNAITQNVNITGNTINNISGGAAFTLGIYTYAGNTVNVSSNIISNFTNSGAGDIYGIYADGGPAVTENIFQNKVYNLNGGGGGAVIHGVVINSPITTNVYNNLVGNLTNATANSAAPAVIGLDLVGGAANTSVNVYYNTVYLNATSSGTDFSTAAISDSARAVATTAALDLRDNILVNNSTPNGAGFSAALFVTNPVDLNYSLSSNNNLFYAGAPGTNHFIFYDGVVGAQSLAAAMLIVTPRETNSVTENPSFASTTGSSVNFLHFAAGTPTVAESAGVNIAGITTDYDGDIRQGNPGYTGTGTAPDLGADENNLTAVVLAVKMVSLSGINNGTVNKLYWNTAGEDAGDAFQLQHSRDGNTFTNVTSVAGRGGSSSYDYADMQPYSGVTYYRILTSSFSGRNTISNTVILKTNSKELISVWPNPVVNTLNVLLPQSTTPSIVELIDENGRKLFTKQTSAHTLTLDMSRYASGVYIIRFTNGNESYSEKFIRK